MNQVTPLIPPVHADAADAPRALAVVAGPRPTDARTGAKTRQDDDIDALQEALIARVFAEAMRPQGALRGAIRAEPDVPLLAWVFAATTIGAELRASFAEETTWAHTDWFEAAASLSCDAYALGRLGFTEPDGHDLSALWEDDDPHLA